MTTEFEFDTPLNRVGTNCEKYDGRLRKFGRADVVPLWVADMDFASPTCVTDALAERVKHPIYGYSEPSDGMLEALQGWFSRRHSWTLKPADVVWTPGTVSALAASIRGLTEKGDRIIVPTPVYPPFLSIVENNKRQLITSRLLLEGGRYQLDFEHIEEQAVAGARMLLLCSPHNPVGRVWDVADLKRLIDIAVRHAMVIVSDEVHTDFVYSGHEHTTLARLAPKELRLVTTLSASKTFNIAGMGLSAAVVSDPADRTAIKSVLASMHLYPFNPLTMTAVEAAYNGGGPWLDALLTYLDGNRRWLHDELTGLSGLRSRLPEASFLTWVDCRELGMADVDLNRFLVEKACIGVNDGASFGPGGQGHIRVNFGTQRSVLRSAISQLKAALAG